MSDSLRGRSRGWAWWFIAHLLLTWLFARAACADLANYPPVGADEVWIMSASFKLRTEGTLGSDLFVGLHNADRHYFLALPVHHFLQATVFAFAGAGIAQARAVSVVAAIALVWMIGWLAYRWFGLAHSVVAAALLVFWRSNITDTDPRPPLLALAQSGRYDVTVLALWWLTILLLAWHLDRPRRGTAIGVGLAAGATALTQFYGVGVVACAGGALAWARRRDPRPGPHLNCQWSKQPSRDFLDLHPSPSVSTQVRTGARARWYWREAAIGFVVPVLLYCAYAGVHWTDFVGQAALKADRVHFLSLRFYASNVANEWHRFAWLTSVIPGVEGLGRLDLVGSWLVLGALPLAATTGIDAWRRGLPSVGLSALAAAVSLAALDASKARVYASLLVPTLSLALAAALATARSATRHSARTWLRATAGAGLLAWIVVNGLVGYRFVADEAPRASRYLDVGQRLAASVEPGVAVLGSQRWWWALRDRPYRSLSAVWQRWSIEQRAGHRLEFAEELASFGRVYLILDEDTRGDLARAPTELQQQVRLVLAARAERVAAWEDRTYGAIEIYRVAQPTPLAAETLAEISATYFNPSMRYSSVSTRRYE